MNESVGSQQIYILEHLLRVVKNKQPLFNSVQLNREQIRECNQLIWNGNIANRLKLLHQLNAILAKKDLSERGLYQVNEKLSLLLSTNAQEPRNNILDGHTLTIILIETLINICHIVSKDISESRIRESLRHSIIDCVQSRFIKNYVTNMWKYAKQEL
ncbi:LAFE_0H08878g1_1 [Lachancea fermentati]|uniref:LAFE_0H08878g1_1 n=1 Tax=Lachancea fermentati TaxID=4955 RepID=A0A1G4MK55_LACFM|nr:LAFE_0H08878g1_1 [Lachancea fermentati]